MIKLNNKNIAYVALADSNNSLKAPKEIWYADSNNSVKLVYRRKDALIEGKDYEKYHLLNGYTNDGATLPASGADIRVNAIPLNNKVLTIELGKISRNVAIWGKSPWFIPMWCVYVANQYIMQLQERNGNDNTVHNMTYSWNTSNIVTLDFQNKVARLGNNSFNIDGSNYNFDGFHSIIWQNPRTVGKIKISDELHLVPCKLLKPVPKWLDANGIRRQVGECGMIDLISGKFYGNVNNVGTFTVENYYERKEWLQGRNGAYIDTNYYPIVGTDVFSVHFHYDGTLKNPNGIEQDVFGVNYVTESSNNFIRTFINRANYLSCSYYKYTNSYPTTFQNSLEWDIVDLMIDGSDFKYNANGVNYSFANNDIQQQTCPSPLFVFKNNDNVFNQNCYLHGDISSFKITDTSSNTKMNLIPCTLTMDLPASMDANNIARTKGTSGMWDLVSDRFYGNVANSGTFKAVNLAEGVDYEVHDWLITENSDGALMMNLPLYTYNFSLKIRILKLDGNCYHFLEGQGNALQYFTTVTNLLRVHKNGVATFSSITQVSFGDDIEIKSTNNSLTFNGEAVPIPDSYFTYLRFKKSVAGTIMKISTSSITVNGIERYIPVKLLRSIPSKYGANGIARNAGECGMYDTVNDVFYGNVASSGTFSVSDDE